MILQLTFYEEFQFLLYFLIIILGIELAFYSIYRFYKLSYKKLPLDKILLAIGTIYFLFVSSLWVFTIAQFFINNIGTREILYGLTIFILQLNIMPLVIFVIMKEFSQIISLKFNYLYLIFDGILIILSLIMLNFIPIMEILIYILTIFLIIAYFLSILVIINRETSGEIKYRLTQVIIGTILSYFSLFFVLTFFNTLINSSLLDILRYLGFIILIAGFGLVIIGIYNFPTFYEFQWRENLIQLFIINQKKNSILYKKDFTDISASLKDKGFDKVISDITALEQLFKGGIKGIDKILAEISYSRDKNLQEIKKGEIIVLLEYGSEKFSHILYALIVRNPLRSYRVFLTKIKNQFENFYKELLMEDFGRKREEQLFKSFDIILKTLIV